MYEKRHFGDFKQIANTVNEYLNYEPYICCLHKDSKQICLT